MNLEEFINKIKEIKIKVPDEHFFLEYNTEIYKIIEENQQLKETIIKAIELIKKCVELQLKEDYLINRVNLMNYNCNLLNILESSDNKWIYG